MRSPRQRKRGPSSSAAPDVRERMSTRAQVGILVAASLSLWGAVCFYRVEAVKQQPDQFLVGFQIDRYKPLREVVPENAMVGYVTDVDVTGTDDNVAFREMIYTGTQYALIPRIVRQGTGQPWVIGDFTKRDYLDSARKLPGLAVERDFGRGVVLFRKAGH